MAKKGGSKGGFGKPPDGSKFKPGKSGNPAGRPRGSKNLRTVMEKELNDLVPITENGREKRLSKGAVAIKQLVNKAAAGDMKALQTILNITKANESTGDATSSLDVFDTAEHALVMADICQRIRAMEEPQPPSGSTEPTVKKDPEDDAT
jgi:hypothetical protein